MPYPESEHLKPGTKLGPYEIQSPLGAGGMGEVYRARDTRLARTVAIKVLPDHLSSSAEAKQRFDREARTISSLNHPHICHLYDIGAQDGTDFLVMEFLEGETLGDRLRQGPIPIDQCLKIGIEISEGLEKAHRSGVMHRDLKPANIFLTKDGHTKLLDFGLARSFSAARAAGADDKTLEHDLTLTSPGSALGTVAYMSPEQARGEAVDERSDLFSLGVVLYEMAGGRRPFDGPTAAVVFDSILNKQPEPLTRVNPGIPPTFVDLLNRLMTKSARQRCQSAHEALEALREIDHLRQSSTSSSGKTRMSRKIPSVAVLPFANLSADPDNQYFSDGLSEDLTSALSRLQGLQVASRTSAFRFRGGNTDIHEIGRQLNVEALVEGSVRRSGNRVRVTAQLVNVADGYQLWSDRYDREITDIFEIQDEITGAIVKMIEPALVGEQSALTRRHSENVQAYELYLKGMGLWEQRGESALRAGLECFRAAVELDPDYALAHTGIADTYTILAVYGYVSINETRPRAMAAVEKAMTLDPSLGEVHCSMGNAVLVFRKMTDSLPHFRRAVEIQPRSSMFHAYMCLSLSALRHAEQLSAEAARATELDPLSPFIHGLTALSLTVGGKIEEGMRNARRALELHPNFVLGMWSLHKALAAMGRWDEAIQIGERLLSISRRGAVFVGQLGMTYGFSGQRDKALALRQELLLRRDGGEFITPMAFLAIDVGLDDSASVRDDVLAYIEDGGSGLGIAAVLGTFSLDKFANCADLFPRIGMRES